MTSLPDWTERGRELGASLDACHAVVVAGSDPLATAEVALGIARQQSAHRRVAVADLLGEVPTLQSLVTSDDPHGIVDSFLFGVSLNRVAYPVPGAGELFVMPSGSTPIDYEEIFGNPRWRRLAGGFREVGALLVLAAPVDAQNLADLVYSTDGAVIVGNTVPGDIPVAQTLAWLRPKGSAHTAIAGAAPLAMVEAAKEKPRRQRRFFASTAGILLTLGFIAIAGWFAYRPYASERPVRRGAAPDSSPLAGRLATDSVALIARADSIRRDSAARAESVATVVDSTPVLVPANPADSAKAAAWAVLLEQVTTLSGAMLDLRIRFESVPVGTFSHDTREQSYLLVAGAYQTRVSAESLLVQLRNHKILAPGLGKVASLPYAFLVQADVPQAELSSRLKNFAGKGLPVYALRLATGAANLYFGAYESSQQAALAVPSVQGAGLTPTLVYRIGRVF
ncbi:MAG: hypothetical protein ABI625_02885 [bacterium]